MDYIVNSVEESIKLGEEIGKRVKPGDIICLTGDLGAGKTHITKGIARGLGITDNVTSPTFSLINEYNGRLKLYHFDVYRINDPLEIYSLGFDEYIFGDGVSVIEWANYIETLIPREHIAIDVRKNYDLGENYRKIVIQYYGNRYNYVKEIKL